MKNVLRAILLLVGMVMGYGLGLTFEIHGLYSLIFKGQDLDYFSINAMNALLALIMGLVFYRSGKFLNESTNSFIADVRKQILSVPPMKLALGFVGLLIGLIVAFLLTPILSLFKFSSVLLGVLVLILYTLLGYIGAALGSDLVYDADTLENIIDKNKVRYFRMLGGSNPPKILDTNVIIDGKIADILDTGFIEGDIVIPSFILKELRDIADSHDVVKRNRGKFGLDVLHRIQKEWKSRVMILSDEMLEEKDNEMKLLILAQKLNAAIVTNDDNLKKMAFLQGIKILNISNLVHAIKPSAVLGENMKILVVKEGKEENQGIGYLDDGTMIVVEDGASRIGEEIEVEVTSMMQSAVGRMFFVKPCDEEK